MGKIENRFSQYGKELKPKHHGKFTLSGSCCTGHFMGHWIFRIPRRRTDSHPTCNSGYSDLIKTYSWRKGVMEKFIEINDRIKWVPLMFFPALAAFMGLIVSFNNKSDNQHRKYDFSDN